MIDPCGEELFSFLTIMLCAQLSTDKTRSLNKFSGLYQCQYPGHDIILYFCKMFPLEETG